MKIKSIVVFLVLVVLCGCVPSLHEVYTDDINAYC